MEVVNNNETMVKTPCELERRVRESQKEIDKYPEWIKLSMIWQGSGDRDWQEDFKSYGNY